MTSLKIKLSQIKQYREIGKTQSVVTIPTADFDLLLGVLEEVVAFVESERGGWNGMFFSHKDCFHVQNGKIVKQEMGGGIGSD